MHLPRSVASVLRIRDHHDCKTLQTMEENSPEDAQDGRFTLRTEVKNCIRHVYEALADANGADETGKVAKSKLQLLCATISRDTSIPYLADDLTNFKENETSLLYTEFIEYLEERLLVKASETIDQSKIQQLSWTIVQQKFFKPEEHVLSEAEAYEQWLVFNILDIDEVSNVHKQELGILLEKLVHAIGKVWDSKPLEEFCIEEEMTFWKYLECLEKCYLNGVDKSIYKEGLDEMRDYVIHEVIKQGYLIKKGHMVKSMKDRWFVLKAGHLSYFTNRSCSEKKGEIIVTKDTKVITAADSRKYRFNVVCGKTKTHYDLEARDQRTRQEWLVAIQKAIDAAEGPSVQKKERMQRRIDRNEQRLAKLEKERKEREQQELLLEQQRELELLRQKYSDAEAQAILEAENLQEEKRRREELERLHQELQNILLAEKEAREAETNARALQEKLLEEEKKRLEELERLKEEKDKMLEEELKKRETLEEKQKLQDKILEEERKRLENLEKERQAAQQAMQEAHDKLAAAEEAAKKASEEAKKKVREIKTCSGLARPIGPHNPAFITHRGIGAFCEGDFEKIVKHHEKLPPRVMPKPKKKPNGESVTEEGEVNIEAGIANEEQVEQEEALNNSQVSGEINQAEEDDVDKDKDVEEKPADAIVNTVSDDVRETVQCVNTVSDDVQETVQCVDGSTSSGHEITPCNDDAKPQVEEKSEGVDEAPKGETDKAEESQPIASENKTNIAEENQSDVPESGEQKKREEKTQETKAESTSVQDEATE
ncbi:switch-associated protein 70 [Nematostella vectensis]|uniref:switch-associated protein 70 n=1 Tax=Nematostella vectensis TaxID=45351 RepID=UPI0020771153|nr:switch-associated protein 70 [Nematostella vectensis]